MESRNLCGKNVAKFRNLLAGSPSQEKLAAKMQLEGLNINKNAIQRIECGKRMVKDIELDVFAKIFHVSVDELMYGPKPAHWPPGSRRASRRRRRPGDHNTAHRG